jgi:hypothetical protein
VRACRPARAPPTRLGRVACRPAGLRRPDLWPNRIDPTCADDLCRPVGCAVSTRVDIYICLYKLLLLAYWGACLPPAPLCHLGAETYNNNKNHQGGCCALVVACWLLCVGCCVLCVVCCPLARLAIGYWLLAIWCCLLSIGYLFVPQSLQLVFQSPCWHWPVPHSLHLFFSRPCSHFFLTAVCAAARLAARITAKTQSCTRCRFHCRFRLCRGWCRLCTCGFLRPSSLSPSCVRSTRYRLLRDKQNALPFPFRCAAGANELAWLRMDPS